MLPRLARLLVFAIVIALTMAMEPALAQELDPIYRFRTIRTDHFAIHFHDDVAPIASALAEVAEETWRKFDARPGVPPPPLTHVVLVDQSESANGFATTLPRNTVVLYAVTPPAASLLNPDDWLRTVFVHEFTHIVHLDRAEGWARAARRLFGRAPWTFPNLMLPLWQIEGLATFEESLPRGSLRPGRQHAGDFTALTLEAARSGAFEPIDRVGGGLTDWPAGLAPYAYGLSFHVWLAERYGAESLYRLSDATAGSFPWLGTRAFSKIYGRSLGDLWSDYTADVTGGRSTPSEEAAPPSRRLTRHGFQVAGPRYLPRSCAACPREIAYSLRTPDDRPGLHVVDTTTLETRRLTTRFFGSTLAPTSDGAIYFDQQERIRNSGLYSDIYLLERDTRHVRRLTHDARLIDPDLSPDGRSLVAIRTTTPGQRELVVIDVAGDVSRVSDTSITTLLSESQTQFNTPRWSSDGQHIVVGRQRPTGTPEIVIVNAATKQVDVLAPDSGLRWATPAWRPDGRAIVAAGARGSEPFNLFEVEIASATVRQLTHHTGGATWPDVSPDGASIVYVGYSATGFDLYEMPYPTAAPIVEREEARAATRAAPTLGEAAGVSDDTAGDAGEAVGAGLVPAPLTARPYRPWTTLLPTSWTPVVTTSREQIRAGAIIGGEDVLGYHAWQASAAWPLIDRVETGEAGTSPDWSASYVYGRWRPQVWTAVSRDTSFYPAETSASDAARPATLVERTAEVGVQLPLRRLRVSHAVQASVVRAVDTFTRANVARDRNRSGARVAWRYSSAQLPGYAISPERGLTLGVAAEFVRPELGASGRAGTVTADARAYLPGLARHHVIAVRAVRGYTWGDNAVGRLFVLGGGDASPGAGSLGSEVARLLRGFPANTFAGRQVATINVDYRFAIARPQRGFGALPLFLHSLHGAVVADAGHVWSGTFDRHDIKTSLGVELSANVVLGYGLPLTLTAGAASGRDGAHVVSSGPTVYARLGYAF
ncbi:MAG: PD40 domain-containing protein [Acidobacteria bacterium]|nr:PD40 domain-containing protein [Acidobacteriota bacterium]